MRPPLRVAPPSTWWISLFVILACVLPWSANAAGFSCLGKLSAQEQLICRDKRLSALDFRMGALYGVALKVVTPDRSLKDSQRNWISFQRSRCTDAPCLVSLYQKRNDELEALIQQYADSLPETLSGIVHHKATATSSYCEAGDDVEWFSVDLTANGETLSGKIDGVFRCGQKVWGPVDVKGNKVGKIALVQFNPSFSSLDNAVAEGMVVVSRDLIFWRLLSDVDVESYVPKEEAAKFSGAR